jgi:hypothetical protein
MCTARNPQVLVQIKKIDAILVQTGVRDHCISCIQGPRGGCCQGCSYLSPTGCTNKPLACALWLCREAEALFPKVSAQLIEIASKWPWEVAHNYRQRSIEAESLL